MKWIIRGLVIVFGFFILLGVVLTITLGLGGNLGLPFGFYGKYNIVQREIEKVSCFGAIDHSLAHEEFTLEYFGFTISTKSDWKIGLWFLSEMDVRQVCERPKGLLVYHPVKHFQVYSMEYLSEALNNQGFKVSNLQDVLCNLDVLVPFLRDNYENDEIPCTDTSLNGYTEYLVITNIPWKRENATPKAVKQPVSTPILDRSNPGSQGLPLRNFEFDVVTLNSNGKVKSKTKMQAPYYSEDLGSGITLEMVQIPKGTFRMGIPPSEIEAVAKELNRYVEGVDIGFYVWREHPQHTVKVPSFFMGKFEVTHAQWRAVSQLPKVSRDLASDPSRFNGDDLPVNRVTWEDAIEFCERLSRATAREYRLPSEAEWEYACRAGTITQFHFGDTITSELANYNGYYSYGSGSWWIAREETTPVGLSGFANAFGLYDMHGNVDEWCLDTWHDNYIGAPTDGSAWIANGDEPYRIIRGGAWAQGASDARTADRGYRAKMSGTYFGGFRVVAVVGNR
jgi:formylglycine-generating enzyme required for sulfatase activity